MKKEFCDKNKYILKYKVTNGELVIFYADGTKKREPYSIDKEKEILATEKRQLGYVVQDEKVQKYKAVSCKWKIGMSIITSLIYIGILCASFNIPSLIIASVFLYLAGRNIIKHVDVYKNIRTIEKYKMFLKNEDIINDAVEAKAKTSSRSRQNGIRKVNANTIDNYSYGDVTEILSETDCKRSEYGDTEMFVNKASAALECRKKKFEKAKVKVKSLFR